MEKRKSKLLEKITETEKILFLGKADIDAVSFLSEKNKVTAVFTKINEKNLIEKSVKNRNLKTILADSFENIKEQFSSSFVFHEDFMGRQGTKEVLVQAGEKTKLNGKIYFLCKTSRGAKNFQKTMKELFGNVKVISVKGGLRLIESIKKKKIIEGNETAKELNEEKTKKQKEFFEFKFNQKDYFFKSSFGVFSKNRIDSGTKLLLETIKVKGKKILDFGCGTGAIGIVLAKENPKTKLLMLDSDLKSVFLAEKNIELNKVNNAKAVVSDGFQKIKGKFNLIVSNPPTHNKRDFLEKFVLNSFKHLEKNGKLVVVLNKKVFLEKEIQEVFGNHEISAEGKEHKVITGQK